MLAGKEQVTAKNRDELCTGTERRTKPYMCTRWAVRIRIKGDRRTHIHTERQAKGEKGCGIESLIAFGWGKRAVLRAVRDQVGFEARRWQGKRRDSGGFTVSERVLGVHTVNVQ